MKIKCFFVTAFMMLEISCNNNPTDGETWKKDSIATTILDDTVDKFTQHKTNRKTDPPNIDYSDTSIEQITNNPAQKETTIGSQQDACDYVEGKWVAILRMGDDKPVLERWNFHCYGDDKIELEFGTQGPLSGNSSTVSGKIYLTSLSFNYDDVRGYKYEIKLEIKNKKVFGQATRTWNSDHKTYRYSVELWKKEERQRRMLP